MVATPSWVMSESNFTWRESRAATCSASVASGWSRIFVSVDQPVQGDGPDLVRNRRDQVIECGSNIRFLVEGAVSDPTHPPGLHSASMEPGPGLRQSLA